MTPFIAEESDPLVDLECGGISSQEPVLDDIQGNTLYISSGGGVRDSSLGTNRSVTVIGDQFSINSGSNSGRGHCEAAAAAVPEIQVLTGLNSGEVVSGEHVAVVEKKHAKEARKKAVYKKAPKPPRPPQGPSLDAADLKLVKEISALATKKRARKERIKAFKKMKEAAKSSSSSNGWISALVITLLFFLVILFQGFRSRGSSSTSFQGSPEPAVSRNSWMSVQFYGNPSANEGIGLTSESPSSSLQQQNSGSEFAFHR